MFTEIIAGWNEFMTDHDDRNNGLHVGVDGGFNISKQAIWRTIVSIALMASSGGTIATKLENDALQREIAKNRSEIDQNKKETAERLKRFESVIDDVVNFLIEEKAAQKSEAAKRRYQEQIEKIRAKMRPVSLPLYAFPEPPAQSIYSARLERE